jgi:NAD+ synthase (glutamine-hydrolysing)
MAKMRIRISIAQINPKTGDLRGNRDRILAAIEAGRRDGAHVVVLPEMCLTGYCLDEKLLLNRQFLRENRRVLFEEIAPACTDLAVVVGFVDFEEGQQGPGQDPVRYNAAAVCHRGVVRQLVYKRLLPSYRYFDDKRYFRPGTEIEPLGLSFPEGDVRIGVLICEDLWDEQYELKPCRVYHDKGVDYLFCINASPFVGSNPGARDGKRFLREALIRRQIDRFGVPIVSVNTVGAGDNGKNVLPFDGASCAYDRSKQMVASLKSFAEDQATVVFENGSADPVDPPEFDREAEIFQALAMSVRDYYNKVGVFKGVLEAVSGGIDSALGTAIAYEAMGPDLLTLYNLPSRYNSSRTQQAARELAENFGLEYKVVPIQRMVDRILSDFEENLHPVEHSLTIENLQARVRGLIMMAESNDREALLLTNGNETEIALGYATLYGDMVGGLAVIGDLSKPDVYRLARYVNRKWGRPVIPEDIFEIPASAELSEGQVDPFDYEVVGPLVSSYVEHGLSPADMIELFRKRELNPASFGETLYRRYSVEQFSELSVKLYRSLNRSVYKRMQAAPIIVVSERSFGFDLRETIINGWEA